jgi:hypothetical protein
MTDQFERVAPALGHLVLGFNELEVALGGALMYLLKQDEAVGAAFVAHLGAAQKIRLLLELEGKIGHEPTRKEFHKLVTRAAEINASRNLYIHSEYWPTYDAPEAMLHRRLRDATKPVTFPIKLDELRKVYVRTADPKEIMDLANDAAQVAQELLQLSENMF